MNECVICHTTLRSDNRSGLCQRTTACRAERYRRELERSGGTGPRCLCSHVRGRHDGDGECGIRACGCGTFRLDPRSPLPTVISGDGIAAEAGDAA